MKGTYSFDEVLGINCEVGRDLKFGVKYSVDGSLAVFSTKWRLEEKWKA